MMDLFAMSRRCRWALLAAILPVLTACNADLYTNIGEREANLMVAELLDAGIAAQRIPGKDGKMTVTVDESRFSEAVRILNDAGLPKATFATLGDVFQSSGLIASPAQERAQMIFALNEELSKTISEIDGIMTARVHVVLEDNDPFQDKATPSSASVFVRHDEATDMAVLIPQIKNLVSNSVSGLVYESVSITPVLVVKTPKDIVKPVRSEWFLGVELPHVAAAKMKTFIGILAFLCMLLAAAVVYLMARQQRRTVFTVAGA